MDLTFNVIYTPGTVKYLHLSALSLVRMSPYRFRLIANGLGGEEQEQLRQVANRHEQLDFLPYPTRHVLDHGTILNLLQQRERDEFFCFMDSDIFASQPFHVELEKCLQTCDVISSCLPLAVDPAEDRRGFEGNCLRTPDGLALAPTYFSVYRNDRLTTMIRETSVGFESFSADQLMPEVESVHRSDSSFPKHTLIDTGKLLNVLGHDYAIRMRHHEFSGLVHVGGLSSYIARARRLHRWGLAMAAGAGRGYVLGDHDLGPGTSISLHKGLFMSRRVRRLQRESDMQVARMLTHAILRDRIAIYFTCLLRHLFDGTPRPIAELRDKETARRVELVRVAIEDTFRHDFVDTRAA